VRFDAVAETNLSHSIHGVARGVDQGMSAKLGPTEKVKCLEHEDVQRAKKGKRLQLRSRFALLAELDR
jgi:hypothetical protein